MIAMIERCAATLSWENLPEGKATVGFEVCVKHVAAAADGATCTVIAKLREVDDGRKLRFDVESARASAPSASAPSERYRIGCDRRWSLRAYIATGRRMTCR